MAGGADTEDMAIGGFEEGAFCHLGLLPPTAMLKEKQEEASEFNYSAMCPGTIQSPLQGAEKLHAL